MAYQKLIIVGNLGRDPEMRYTPDGTPVTTFSIATTRKWNNSEGAPGEETTWFRITTWRRQAEIAAQYLTKGRQVMVEGHLTPDRATGGPRVYQRQDGTYGASFEVTADRVVFLSNRGGSGGSEDSGEGIAAEPMENYPEDEIPF